MSQRAAPGAHAAGAARPGTALLSGLALAAAALGWHPPARPGGVLISPVRIEIASPRKAVAVTVTNRGAEPLTLQSAPRTWRQVEGRDVHEPTDELLVVPAIAQVAPGASQVFRIALRRPVPAPVERSYRLLLEDISTEQAPPAPGTLRFRISHDLPVFVAAARPDAPHIGWRACPAEAAGKACVRLVNEAGSRIRVKQLTLAAGDWQETLALPVPVTLLAGASREWQLAPASLPAGGANSLSRLVVHTQEGQALPAHPQ